MFESNGRVWFVTHSCETLLSYDGKTFVEYACEGKGRWFKTTCPNTGLSEASRARYGCNAEVDKTVFFAGSHGVLTVTGDKSNYHELTAVPPAERGNLNYPTIVAEADKLGVIAYVVVDGKMILHRWRKGKWTEIVVPGKFPKITAVVPWSNGVWIFRQWQSMHFLRYPKGDAGTVRDLVARLGDDKHAIREDATKRLVAMGVAIMDDLIEARKATDDPEVIFRLDKVLAASKPTPGASRIGCLELKNPGLGLFEGGWMYITSTGISEDGINRGIGVALVKPDGTHKFFLGRQFATAFGYDAKPLVVKEHAFIWTGYHNNGNPGAMLLDVEKGAFVADFHHAAFWWPNAVKSDGTVYLRQGATPHAPRTIVFRPPVAIPPEK